MEGYNPLYGAMVVMMAFSDSDLFKKAGIPENYVPLCGVLLGYSGGESFANKVEKKDNVNYRK